MLQVRGSIPLYWTQNSLQRRLKPDIQLQRHDPLYKATRLHFADLQGRYGQPLVALNLCKSSEKQARETLLLREYERAVQYLNQQVQPPACTGLHCHEHCGTAAPCGMQ